MQGWGNSMTVLKGLKRRSRISPRTVGWTVKWWWEGREYCIRCRDDAAKAWRHFAALRARGHPEWVELWRGPQRQLRWVRPDVAEALWRARYLVKKVQRKARKDRRALTLGKRLPGTE